VSEVGVMEKIKKYFDVAIEAYPNLKDLNIDVDIADLDPDIAIAKVETRDDKYIIQFSKKAVEKMSDAEILATILHELAHILIGMGPEGNYKLSVFLDWFLSEFIVWLIAVIKAYRILDKLPQGLRRDLMIELAEVYGRPESPVHGLFDCIDTYKKYIEKICRRKSIDPRDVMSRFVVEDTPLTSAMTTLIALMYVVKTIDDPREFMIIC